MAKQEDDKKKQQTESEYDDDVLAMLGLDGPGKAKPKKPVFYFREIGLVMPIWGLLTLEKEMRWEDKPKQHPVYCIVINRGMEPSQNCPIGEKCITYEKENIRDKSYDEIVDAMESTAFKVIIV